MPLNVVCSLSSGILRWMPFELMRLRSSLSLNVIGSWVFYFPTNLSYWRDDRYLAPWWVFPAGCQWMVLRYLHSALQARKQMCSYRYLVHESLQIFDLAFWCCGIVLRNLITDQMIRLKWGAPQVHVNARSRCSHYPIWGLESLIGPFQPTHIFRLLSRLRTPLGRYPGGG
jgi:hypothetical protein